MDTVKGDWHRLGSKKDYDACPLWENREKRKQTVTDLTDIPTDDIDMVITSASNTPTNKPVSSPPPQSPECHFPEPPSEE